MEFLACHVSPVVARANTSYGYGLVKWMTMKSEFSLPRKWPVGGWSSRVISGCVENSLGLMYDMTSNILLGMSSVAGGCGGNRGCFN